MRIKYYNSFFLLTVFILFTCHTPKRKNDEINKVILCAIERLMNDPEFREHLITGKNYFHWQKDAYSAYDSINCDNQKLAWISLPSLELNKNNIYDLGRKFPDDQKLNWVNSDEYENIIKNKNDEKFSCWFIAGIKNCKTRYFFEAGFLVSTVAGTGAFFIIDYNNGKCDIIDYAPVIF